MRKTMFALLVAGSVMLPLGSMTASAGPASFLGSNLHVARTGNSVSTVNYYRRYGYDWCCGPRYYSNYYYAPRGYGYYLPPAVYYPPPVVTTRRQFAITLHRSCMSLMTMFISTGP